MPSFMARFILDDNDVETFDAEIDTDDWTVGPDTVPELVPETRFPKTIPGNDVEDVIESYWDFQHLANDGVPVYKYRSFVGSPDEYPIDA